MYVCMYVCIPTIENFGEASTSKLHLMQTTANCSIGMKSRDFPTPRGSNCFVNYCRLVGTVKVLASSTCGKYE